MPDFSIALSGLKADSTALNTIANNLSNMNTTGYKAQTTTFSDLLYQNVGSSGSGDSIQVGTGVQVATNTTDFTSGSLSSTGCTSSDVAINGNGFFVLDNNGSQLYTRSGAFTVSSDGTLESSGGLAVMGYSATDGAVNTSGALSDITIPTTKTMAPSATTTFSVTQTLDSAGAVGTTATSPVTVYDSLGESYTATVTYTKTGTNEWSYNVTMPDTLNASKTTSTTGTSITYGFGSSDGTLSTVNTGTNLKITGLDTTTNASATITAPTITSGETLDTYATALNDALSTAGITGVTVTADDSTGTLTIAGTTASKLSTSGSVVEDPVASSTATGTLSFDSDGNLTSPSADVSGITFSGLSDGAATLDLNWGLFGTTGTSTVTQTASTSTTGTATQNGYSSGKYDSFSIDSSGVVSAKFSNGKTETVGQLAIATVSNEQGLEAEGSTEYASTTASGNASVGVAGTGGRGSIEDSELEASNVDVSTEFAALIVAQRAFEASSKAVTTFDNVTQQAISMVK
jgi:flagellar hook protein FlgE